MWISRRLFTTKSRIIVHAQTKTADRLPVRYLSTCHHPLTASFPAIMIPELHVRQLFNRFGTNREHVDGFQLVPAIWRTQNSTSVLFQLFCPPSSLPPPLVAQKNCFHSFGLDKKLETVDYEMKDCIQIWLKWMKYVQQDIVRNVAVHAKFQLGEV